MNAVWRVARAAVRRRKLQTIVIWLVVAASTGTIVMALGLLSSTSAPYDRAFAAQRGAHVVAAFDRTLVTDAQVSAAARKPGVEAVAGPFAQLTVATTGGGDFLKRSMTTVGRADPAGPVDRLDLWSGRWVNAPGEVVLNEVPGQPMASNGTRIELADGTTLTVVGAAYSISGSADAWVTPAQAAALHPTTTQMLYRFAQADTQQDIDAGKAAVFAGLPAKSVFGGGSYLAVKAGFNSETAVYIPFLVVFGLLGLAVAILIVANVVSGAVVAGYRNIGVLKALGFSPNQVMAVYLVMVGVPALAGCVVGIVAGNVVARPVLADAFAIFGTSDVGVDLWVDVAALIGVPLVVALAALVSALRARGLPAAEAISASSRQRRGRALRVQRWLGGVRLPRSVSLGLGVPFARPARSLLTLAAIVLGVTTVTLAIGVTLSANAYNGAVRPVYPDRIEVLAGGVHELPPMPAQPGGPPPAGASLTDAQDEAMLRGLPGTQHVTATVDLQVAVVGGDQAAEIEFSRGDNEVLGPKLLEGHWPGPGEVVVPSRFLNARGLSVGDTVTFERSGHRLPLRIAGITLTNPEAVVYADWAGLARLAPDARADTYVVQLAPGTDQTAYAAAMAKGDPGLVVMPPRDSTSSQAVVLVSSATVLTVILGAVSALGVFNTVALNARERRRDLGMLKSIGMTPRQVVVIMVTSMGGLGVVGGLLGVPLGLVAHHVVLPAMMRAAQSDIFDFVVHVYQWPVLALLGLAGVLIAVLGAYLPARSAGRLTIATVLHNE
ncbi:FtsX-like permease family protein [Labedaea rhizosphaerae]|uniref:Putative ABC transport system permease protein n=1 Tax=Labedaea rhizosphaerae TaxID=598644 RepID=A0A4R6SE42_LABRH|nr:FtsX-like permease family protein [Labedaea rhizosphaerae]TDP98162.1 putative ABC transport system permease protein [Labedaea rhizosphaerae]